VRLAAILVVSALACSPPPLPCRPAKSQPPALTELLIAWETSLRLEGPTLSCLPPAESLGARVEAAGPTSASLPVQLAFDENRTASLEIELSPLRPGRYRLTVFVEPALSVISAELLVPRDLREVIPVATSSSCDGGHQRTSLGTAVCETGEGVRFEPLDGGVLTLSATTPMVADDVLWLNVRGAVPPIIERRVERTPGQFELTHRFIGVQNAQLRSADERRYWADDRAWTTFGDGGVSLTAISNQAFASYRFGADDGWYEISPFSLCRVAPTFECWGIPGVPQPVGLERTDELLWVAGSDGGGVLGVSLPPSSDGGEVFRFGKQLEVSRRSTSSPVRIVPRPLAALVPELPGEVIVLRGPSALERWRAPFQQLPIVINRALLEFRSPDGGSLLYWR